MTRWSSSLIAVAAILLLAAPASTTTARQSHTETFTAAKPIRLYHPKTALPYKVKIVKRVVRHAEHVQAFFETHPKQARSLAGRAALWRHGRILRAALRAVREIRRELWFTLQDAGDWVNAVRISQRPYPGTQDFQLRTSDDEGGRGIWKPYSGYGERYYAGYGVTIHRDAVGGWMQYRPSTFSGHWRRAKNDLAERKFVLPKRLRHADLITAWRSPLAQALAAGWACWSGNTFSHWSASGNGCG